MQTIFLTADDELIAVHDAQVPPMEAYPSATQMYQVRFGALKTIAHPTYNYPVQVLVDDWREFIEE